MAKRPIPRSNNELTTKCISKAVAAGWLVKATEGGHICFFPKDKCFPPIYTSSTPGDPRAPRDLRARLRRSGLAV